MADSLNSLVGHEAQREILLQCLHEKNLAPAYILSGPKGVGKKMLVRHLLQKALCQSSGSPCGQCSPCARVTDLQNEFIYELHPQEKKRISVAQVRELMPFLNLQTMSAIRFVLVDPADQMSVQAANALLKVIEEPPEKTHFFLITDRYSSLLSTIRSRCQLLRFRSLSNPQMQKIPGVVDAAIPWAQGRPGLALRLSEPDRLEDIDGGFDLLYNLTLEQTLDWKKKSPQFFQNPELQDLYFRLWGQCFKRRLQGERAQELEFLPQDEKTLLGMEQAVQKARSDFEKNVDKVLVVENLFYDFKRAVKSPEEALWNSPMNF